MKISIATWNMDYWKRNTEQRKSSWKYLTEILSPDIALIQEFVPPTETNERYSILYREIGGKRKWGTAIISRDYPLKNMEIKMKTNKKIVKVIDAVIVYNIVSYVTFAIIVLAVSKYIN